MDVRVRVDAEKATQEFREARRDVNTRAKDGIRRAGEQAILPKVRDRAPSIVSPWLTVRSTGRRGYITVQGERKRDRITGLLNFGGTVRTPIRPVEKKALRFRGTNDVRGAVTTPRTYLGRHFLEQGVEAGQPEFERIMTSAVMRAFDGLEHS